MHYIYFTEMQHKLVFTLLVILVAGYISAAPHSPPQTQQELITDFSRFLRENKDIAEAFENVDLDHFKTRNRRDAIDDDMMDVENVNGQEPPKDGFFDRAAKFVMEALQRFLKWLNTDN